MKDQWPLAFCLFCKILLEHTYLSKISLYICVARENLRPRHAVNFSMPCAWSGVKIFANLHLRNCSRSAIETSFIALTYSQLCVFAFLHLRNCFRSAIETKFHCAHLLAALQMRNCSRSAYYSSITSKSLKFFPSTVKRTSVRTCCQPCMPAAPGLMCRRERFLS